MEKRAYKVALISWPIKNKFPHQAYINLGEIYDRKLREDMTELSRFHRELSYLYPFRCVIGDRITCYNIEDITYFQKKYKLTVRIRTQGTFESNTVTFRSPVLYDITNMRPIFKTRKKPKFEQTREKKQVCVVLPYENPVLRGKLLENCLALKSDLTFMLLGDKQGRNADATSTLANRYLLTRSVDSKRMVKSREGQQPDCLLDAVAIIGMLGIEDYILAIVCSSEDITELSWTVRRWRKNDGVKMTA